MKITDLKPGEVIGVMVAVRCSHCTGGGFWYFENGQPLKSRQMCTGCSGRGWVERYESIEKLREMLNL